MRMDTAERSRDLTMQPWRRWTLLAALVVLGLAYVAAFWLFLSHSRNFIEEDRNRSALAYSSAHPLAVPSTVAFGLGEDGNPHLGGGWHLPDGGGVWMATKRGTLALDIRPTGSDMVLAINGTVAAAASAATKVKLRINGRPLASWVRTHENAADPLVTVIPATTLQSGTLELTISVNRLISPLQRGEGPDGRNLGFLLQSIELRSR